VDDGATLRPDVRIGIVSWNTAAVLDRCLTLLPAALGGLSAEVVVVDNASSDDSVDVARSHAGVGVQLRADNGGYGLAMNQALGGTEAPVLIALNPDTEPFPGSLRALVDYLGQHPKVGLVVPTLLGSDGEPQRSVYPYPGMGAALENGIVPPRWRRTSPPRVADGSSGSLHRRWAVGAVHCIRSAALAGQAPYSTRWFMYAEDIELCWRLRRTGWSLVSLRGVVVVHHGNVAGAQRWGEGAELELRSLPNIYDWVWTDRSPLQGRATAAVNACGVAAKGAALQLAAALRRGAMTSEWEHRAAELRTLRGYHGAVARHGPKAVTTRRSTKVSERD
jgi:N-acetylglucosaminyl-diphospho-decaprenol L-rhamnosyltransferase